MQCLYYKGRLNTFYILSRIIFSTMNFMYFHFCYSNFWFWKCCTPLIYHNWTKKIISTFSLWIIISTNYLYLYLRITFQLIYMLNNALGICDNKISNKKYATYYTQHENGPLAHFLKESSVSNVNDVKWRRRTDRFHQNSYWLQITTKTILILQTYISATNPYAKFSFGCCM
jgi:hypothetical protein